MPEYREVLACTFNITRWFRSLRTSGADTLRLQSIWVDSTKPEIAAAPKGTRSSEGHVFKLAPTDRCPRGSRGSQQQVYPPAPWSARSSPNVKVTPSTDSGTTPNISSAPFEPLQTLWLRGVEATPRTVVLDLGRLFLQIQLHTHVMSQAYTRTQWDDEIYLVTGEDRGFRVAIALDFGLYVLAFLTLDNIWTPHWSSRIDLLPTQHVDVYLEYSAFLRVFGEWLKKQSLSKTAGTGLAINVFRGANTIFGGLGVYTICEVWYMAGLPVFISATELLRSPSRLARFCEAFWVFAHISHTKLEAFLTPFYHGFVLAATQEQRMKYIQWLHVFGKHHTWMSKRMKALHTGWINTSKILASQNGTFERSPKLGLYDVFEPSLLRPALEKTDDVQLGPLVFGATAWERLTGQQAQFDDPLSCALREIGIPLDAQTHLNTDVYVDRLYLPDNEVKSVFVPTYLYNDSNKKSQKPLWGILPNYSANVTGPDGIQPSATLEIQAKEEHTLKYIIEFTCKAAVGPLEYCAVARPVYRQGAGKNAPIIPVCRNSPILAASYAARENARRHRQGVLRTSRGKSIVADKKSSGPGGWGTVSVDTEPLHTIQARQDGPSATISVPDKDGELTRPRKRVRLSSDARLVLDSSTSQI